jgi:hypothetical protein
MDEERWCDDAVVGENPWHADALQGLYALWREKVGEVPLTGDFALSIVK